MDTDMNNEQIQQLKDSNRRMQAELIELKDINAGQSQFLDALENLLCDHGYKLVDTSSNMQESKKYKLKLTGFDSPAYPIILINGERIISELSIGFDGAKGCLVAALSTRFNNKRAKAFKYDVERTLSKSDVEELVPASNPEMLKSTSPSAPNSQSL